MSPVSSCLLPPASSLLSLAGLALIGAGLWALLTDAEGWNTIWYIPAWYGYLLLLDALILCAKGRSFLFGRLRETGAMLFWSVPFWYLFEACNLVLENWYYVFTPRTDPARLAMGTVAFATVFPACFFHAELFGALGLGRLKRFKPRQLGSGWQTAALILGTACIALPLLFPASFFWAIWWAPFWIPEVVNYRSGAPSLLRDVEEGKPARLLQMIVGGLVAGGIWELFNYWARCKWIYTVPGFESWKVFEMPVVGFLGFPVLALGAFSSYSLICQSIRGGRHWQQSSAGQPARQSGWRFGAAAVLAVGVVLVVHQAGKANVRSLRPLLHELQGLDVAQEEKLRRCGIPTPERLYRQVSSGSLDRTAQLCRIDPAALESAFRHAALALHKGMGAEFSKLLLKSGIQSVSDLADQDADRLALRLQASAASNSLPVPRLAEVRVWVRAAEPGKGPRR